MNEKIDNVIGKNISLGQVPVERQGEPGHGPGDNAFLNLRENAISQGLKSKRFQMNLRIIDNNGKIIKLKSAGKGVTVYQEKKNKPAI